MVGIFGEAPVVLNWPSLSRLLGLFCANAAVEANSTATEALSNICFFTKRPPSLQLLSSRALILAHGEKSEQARRAEMQVAKCTIWEWVLAHRSHPKYIDARRRASARSSPARYR